MTRSLPRRIGFAALATGLGLLVLEGGARIVERARPSEPVEARSPLAFQQLPATPLLRPVEGFPGWRVPAPGLIDDPSLVVPPKEMDELRIVVLGGSAVGGWSVARGATFPAVLGDALDGVGGPVRVLNLGRIGYATPQLAWAWEQLAPELEADLVVVVAGNNELHDLSVAAEAAGGARGPLLRRELFRRSALARLLRPPRPVHGEPDGRPGVGEQAPPDDPPDAEELERYAHGRLRRSLRRIARATEDVGAGLLLATVATNHRYRPTEHPWSWLPDDAWADDDVRFAWFALQYGEPGRGVAALADRQDDTGRLLTALLMAANRDADEAAALALPLAAAADRLPADPDRARFWLQAVRLASGLGPAREAVREGLDRVVPHPGPRGACDRADLLWIAEMPEARSAYAACRAKAGRYRADDTLNAVIARTAEELDVPLVDLAGAAVARAPRGVPDYDLFYDYCHYTPRGNVWVGHLLAARVARMWELPAPPSAALAERGFVTRFADRTRDEEIYGDWVGVSADVSAVASLRYGDGVILHDEGEPGTAEQALFAGNRLADRGSVAQLGWLEAAADSWCRGLAIGRFPSDIHAPTMANLLELLKGPAGPHLRSAAGPDAFAHCRAGERPWRRPGLPTTDGI